MKFKEILLVTSVCGVTTVGSFLSGSLTVALPTIGKSLNFTQADLQWPLNVYALSYGCTLLFFARLADVFGSKKLFIAGSSWFALWSLATAFAPNDKAFITFMAMKGMGAAANTPAGIGIVASYFDPGPTKNRVFAAVGAGQPVGFIIGLVLGGILCDSPATWRSIYYIQTALSILLTALAIFSLPPDDITHRYSKGIDWGGAVLSTLGIALLTYSLSESTATSLGWRAPYIPSLFVTSLTILALFIVYELHRESKGYSVLMPISIWRQPGTRMFSIMGLVFFAWWSFNALTYFATLYYQQVIALSPIQTSLRFVPMALSGFIVNVLTGLLLDHVPGQPLLLLGLVGSISAPLLFALMDVHSSYWAMAFLVMILVVAGADVAYAVANLLICSSMDRDSQALAGGIFNMVTRLGTSLGLAITSSISTSVSSKYFSQHPLSFKSTSDPGVLMTGFRAAGWTCFGAAVLSFGIGAVGLRGIGYVGRQRIANSQGDARDGIRDGELEDVTQGSQAQSVDHIPMTSMEKKASHV